MYKFYSYLFYRIVTSKLYQTTAPKYPVAWSSGLLPFCQTLNILSLFEIYGILTKIFYPIQKMGSFLFLFLYIIDSMIFTEKKIIILKKKYQNEKLRKLKGWGVFSYIIFSLGIFVALNLFYSSMT